MLIGNKRMLPAMVALALLAGGADAADAGDDVIETRARAIATPDEVNRRLAGRAHAAAVRDAVEAVLADNRLRLDRHLIDYRIVPETEYAVAGR